MQGTNNSTFPKPIEAEKIKVKQGIWRTYDATDGLPGIPRNLLQDKFGYLWIGTEAGLCRYDGIEFFTYTTKDGLPGDIITSLCQDNLGKLWMGIAGRGISCFDGKRFTNYNISNENIDLVSLCFDNKGQLWIGTTGKGIFCFDGKQFTNYTTAHGLSNDWVEALCMDSDGRLWIGTMKGLNCFDGQSFTTYTTVDGLASDPVFDLCYDRKKRLWIASQSSNSGVSCFDGQTFKTYTTDDGLIRNYVNKICEDHLGRLWFGCWGGLSCFEEDRFTKSYNDTHGMWSHVIYGIAEDREGQIWLSHAAFAGLSCFDEDTIQFLTDEPVVWLSGQDKKSRIWFGSYKVHHAIQLNADTSEVYHRIFPYNDEIAESGILGYMIDSKDRLWFGVWHTGLYLYESTNDLWDSVDNGKLQNPFHFKMSDELDNNSANALLESKDGTVWIGIGYNGCLSRFDPSQPSGIGLIESIDGLPNDSIVYLVEDSMGRLWIGRHGHGFSCWDGKKLTTYTKEDGLPNNNIGSIVEDDIGRIWVSTNQGLTCFDGERFTTYGEEYGFRGVPNWYAVKDIAGQLWFATRGGVYRTDGKHFQWLTKDDGLPSNNIAGLHPQPDGTMIICTSRGIVRYRMTAKLPPRIEIRELIADKVYQNPDEIELTTTSANLLTISYHGLSLVTKRMKYSYILEGYDEKWHETWERQVRYENLPIGDYTFEVMAINRDLVASESPAEMKLRIVQDPRDIRVNELESSLIIKSQQLAFLQRRAEGKYQFEKIIGKSEAIEWVKDMMITAIESGLNVLITGETGTGKEQIAMGIHYNSLRKDKPYIPYNCGTAQKEFLKSDLFGHRKGAFTGAIENKMGLFETAQGGTALLDEIGDMPLDAQAYLLDVLEKHKVQRMGEYILRDIDVRIISMTNRDLSNEMKEGRFREDLYFRLSRFNIYIPPLRERKDDIPLLAEHFYQKACQTQHKELDGFAIGVIDMLISYQWPGNVRELENEINRAFALAQAGSAIQSYHFSPNITHGESMAQEIISKRMDYNESLKQFRRRLIEKALQECDGNRTKAADILGIDRTNLVHLIKSLGIK